MRLEGRHVVVVGAGSGMGRATAALLHREGAHVTMSGRSRERLEESAAGFSPGLERLSLVTADMTRASDRGRLFDSLDELDDLVVTAADLVYPAVAAVSEDDMDTVLRSKVAAPFFLAQHAAEKMSGTGSITFVSGVAAERPLPTGVLAGAANGALNAMVRGLALALAPVRVNTVSPGWVDSPLWRRITDEEGKRAAFESMAARIPAGRIGRPEDVADAILAVMTNDFMSGSTLYVDGGQRLV